MFTAAAAPRRGSGEAQAEQLGLSQGYGVFGEARRDRDVDETRAGGKGDAGAGACAEEAPQNPYCFGQRAAAPQREPEQQSPHKWGGLEAQHGDARGLDDDGGLGLSRC